MDDFMEVKIQDLDRLRKFTDDLILAKNLKSTKRLVPWYYTPETTSNRFPQFSHPMFGRDDMRPSSKYFDFFYEIVDRTFKSEGIEYNGCIRACLNATWHIPGYKFGCDPHVDNYENHYSTILYLNEVEGNTVLFDAEHKQDGGDVISVGDHDYKLDGGTLDYDDVDWENNPIPIKHEVVPEFGKILIFNGKYLHALRPTSPGNLRMISVFNVEF